MVLTIHQPEHLPWLGFFHKAAQADVMVLLDTVAYRHKYFHNRNRVRAHDGAVWLNVPVLHAGLRGQLFTDVQIDPSQPRWSERCWRTLSLNYRGAPHFDRHAAFFEETYRRTWTRLVDLNLHCLRYLCDALGIRTRLVRASELGVSGAGPQLILDLAVHLQADTYISGISGIAGRGRDFEGEFARRGIAVRYQEFRHPVYRQRHDPFLPCMSLVDLLLNHGPASLDIVNGVGIETLDTVFH